MRLIHYGAEEFKPELFKEIENRNFVKPGGGLWASPVGSEYGWIDWCKMENFQVERLEKYFEFNLSEQAKLLRIDEVDDIKGLPWNYYEPVQTYYLDFEKLAEDYDAIFLTVRGVRQTKFTKVNLYGWDCESVLIMNKEMIEIYERTG